MEDRSLFSANNPIGRVWYFINLFILGIIVAFIHIGIKYILLPKANASYELAIQCILYFAYIFFIMTFFMLIDRRLYDIFESRDSNVYNLVSKIIGAFVTIYFLFGIAFAVGINISEIFYSILYTVTILFALLVFILGFIPGKLTHK